MRKMAQQLQPFIEWLSTDFIPKTPEETLLSRIAAIYTLTQTKNTSSIEAAKKMITQTSVDPGKDLEQLNAFAATVSKWGSFNQLDRYRDSKNAFIEYEISVELVTREQKQIRNVAKFQQNDEACLFVEHLDPLNQVRIIGDEILAQPGKLFPLKPTEEEKQALLSQVKVARQLLIRTGGAGIAANQCAAIETPYRFTIVGVYWEDTTHAENVSKRYPDVNFPKATLMINPEIIESSQDEMVFRHGCLSVPGGCRGDITTPKTITVGYHTLNADNALVKAQQTMTGIDAVVLQHELNHILFGDTYVDRCLSAFTKKELETFIKTLQSINDEAMAAELGDTFYHFVKHSEKENTSPELLPAVLKTVLQKAMTPKTKAGFLSRAQNELAKRTLPQMNVLSQGQHSTDTGQNTASNLTANLRQ